MVNYKYKSQLADNWDGPNGDLGTYIANESNRTLEAYRHQPILVHEHANLEEDVVRGGYAHRQLLELVQNSADALAGVRTRGRIVIRLTEAYLYCADNGKLINPDGVKALMFSNMSPKRGTSEIGRFGLGFKSVLGVTDVPEFLSRSGSFCFDRGKSRARIQQFVPDAVRYPVLRLPDPIDPCEHWDKDNILRELAEWATNVVRLPLKPKASDDLGKQMRDFPSEFLLFVEHVNQLTLVDDRSKFERTLELIDVDGDYLLADSNSTSQWKLFKDTYRLSEEAQADRRSLDDDGEVPIWWAASLDRLSDPGQFWAFFPTKTASLVAGILNAPWKTNEDRQNLLPGPYNDELIESAAKMIADKLPNLATKSDPARHLDALPRRHEAGDSDQADRLRRILFSNLYEHEVVPDQDGCLRVASEILYPPKELTADRQMDTTPFERWGAYTSRPSDWLHHKALTRNRLAAIDRLFPPKWPSHSPTAPRTTIAKWLEALVSENNVEGSKSAIQTAALIPPEIRSRHDLGDIVLTADGELREPDPECVFLPDEAPDGVQGLSMNSIVHSELASDHDTLVNLKKLGIKPPSPISSFKQIATEVLNSNAVRNASFWTEFWKKARRIEIAVAHNIIKERINRRQPHVLTRSGNWQVPQSVLLPGDIVPTDSSRDEDVTVDLKFHDPDVELLMNLGVTKTPCDYRDLSSEISFRNFRTEERHAFTSKDRNLQRNPQLHLLNFVSTMGCGPLGVLTKLSDKSRANYTDALLSLEATYERWTMKHDTQGIYPSLSCESLTAYMLRKEGRVQTTNGVVPFKDALGQKPKNPAALHALLMHSKVDKIKKAFDLAEPIPEFFGEQDPIPLIDVWPGLEKHLHTHQKTYQLIRCERILVGNYKKKCAFHVASIFLAIVDNDNKSDELRLVSSELNLGLNERELEAVLQYETRQEIEKLRALIKKCSSDAERLLNAVGEQALREDLPDSLIAILEEEDVTLTGVQVAEAAIATYHSDTLKHYRWALEHLDPPRRWAGSARAVDFVRSLGFSAEWAGERNKSRAPFLEIEGPYSLPELHDYQRTIVANVRNVFQIVCVDGGMRRGMISMPTGSGKTRVAVQAIIEAMCHDGFKGGVLWVADRDELCEQAVESWQQVWSSIGQHKSRLRVSRMWAGQPRPLSTSDLHVVVATIQTLNARLNSQPSEYEFLTEFTLVVFDEAHRSIAPTFTAVMQEIGLTWRQKADEPYLLGLTATPYRGYNEEETAWLTKRYAGNRLDAGAFESDDSEEVIIELQNMGVLAKADHDIIEGVEISLDREELQQIESTPWLPKSVEDRIASDSARTKRIIKAYETYIDSNWPTLIFATSVEHSKTVAALLNSRGIKSRAVSGETESSIRRRVVEEFRSGEIKALVNYGVFREGFDAPKTRAIVVARPVYSPNLYFQMIGRGLRGVKNGGSNRCLILNVQDNIQNFQRALAFSELDWLWA